MAEGVRKSNRIKSRTRTIYTEDDFDYELHYDVSSDISSILESHSKQNNSHTGRKKPFSKVCKKSDNVSKLGHQDVKSDTKNYQRAFGDVIVNTTGGDSPAISLEDAHITCPICKEIFVSEQLLEDHMNQHQNGEGDLNGCLVCDICDRICLNQSSYNKHMKLHSCGRKLMCDVCEKTFTDSCSLKRHLKSHVNERPFICDICFKSFRDKPTLLRHHSTHTSRPRMHQCLTCDKSFADKHSLKRHERTHTGLRPFECNICLKTFSETGSFKRHLKIHSGVRNFSCPICKRSFLEKQSLIRHQKNVCGFVDTDTSDNSILLSVNQNHDSCVSGAESSEISHASVGEGISSSLNESSVINDSTNAFISASSTVEIKSSESRTCVSNIKASELDEKSETQCKTAEAPSLHSLILKDPYLYNSITEIVDSIDSYEKMMDLCGETGQKEIDAALTVKSDSVLSKVTLPLPDNLMCFECGELLVNGENFTASEKCLQSSLHSSLKCFNCKNEDHLYGEPPVLTAEESIDDLSLLKDEPKLEKGNNVSRDLFETDESLEHLRERLRTQHGVLFFGSVYNGSDDDSYAIDNTDVTCSNTTTSRSHSTDNEVVQTLIGRQSPPSCHLSHKENTSFAISNVKINSHLDNLSEKSPVSFSATEGQNGMWTSITPKMDYEVDDQKIPSVFPCHLCTKVFATSSFLSRHLDLHKNSPHKCMVCGKSFTNSQSLKRHMTTHTGEKPYACPYCRKRFRDPSNFSKHKKLCSTLSIPSPVETALSTSSVSSSQSLDDSAIGENVGVFMTDLKQKISFPLHSSTSDKMSMPNVLLTKFSSDDEDLPVRFSHPTAESDISSENGDKCIKGSVSSEPEGHLPHNDEESIQTETEQAGLLVHCTVCEKTFQNELSLEMHMKYHEGDPKVTCIDCGKSFADQFGLKRHTRIHAGVRPHVCEYCGRGYCDNWSLRKHKSRGCMLLEVKVPVDFLHPCPQCTRVFSELEHLDEHMKTHKGLLKFECDICQKKFSEAFNLKRHRRLHMAICPGCDKEFRDIQALTDHRANDCPVNIPQLTTAEKEDGFPCPECGRVYSTRAYLERHKKFHSDLRPFVCEICSKRFSEAFRLRRHIKVHSETRSFKCHTCGKRFTDTASFKRHMTSTSCSLTKHELPQQEPVDYPCPLCDKIFTKNYILARHMNVHSLIRPFACDECERTYKDISSLRRHQLVHQGIKSFICTVCDKDFYYADSLKRHMTGSCGKKHKSRRRRSRSFRRKRKNTNNNTSMKNNNTAGKDVFTSVSQCLDITTDTEPQNQTQIKSPMNQACITSRNVKIGHWSCHKRKQCWRCHLKFETAKSLFKHSRIHCHEKPYHCPHCYIRWSRKPYLKVHLITHKSDRGPKNRGASNPIPGQPPKEELKRSLRSVSRAR